MVLLIDDAEAFDDVDGAIARLLSARPPLHVVAAARADALRSLYGHWTQEVRRRRSASCCGPTSTSTATSSA